ncbi:hypothetical protein AJ80_03706 [Polytolypa hystricis UAMH7299]|uniref:RTA1 domain-containing protein n=1 Tax=Polytolypa hystricis (strain UAMH7299) TaxID=1447883 RepID=A0A2B7YEU7_POLH7|nr:hypothetical protein AJ80_03706 [Polytolypa hystricis UAMH7299]
MGWSTICDFDHEDAQYLYCANGPAAVLFSALFGLTLVTHILQAVLYKRKYCWVIIMAAFWECAGLACRAYSTKDQTKPSTASAGQLLVLLSPLWVNGFVYMVFGRMVWFFLPEQKIAGIKALSMAKIFVWLDILAFIVQGTGGIMDSGFSAEVSRIGLRIYTAGIAAQQFFVTVFAVLLGTFFRRMLQGRGNFDKGTTWKPLTIAMFATISLITIRICFRLAEFAKGPTSPPSILSRKEVFFYVLECLTMWAAITTLAIWHPGRLMPGEDGDFPKKDKPSRKEKKAMKNEEKERKKQEKIDKKEAKKGGRKNRSRSRSKRRSDMMPLEQTRISSDYYYSDGGR